MEEITRRVSEETAPLEVMSSLMDIQTFIKDLGENPLKGVVFGSLDEEGTFTMLGAGQVPRVIGGLVNRMEEIFEEMV